MTTSDVLRRPTLGAAGSLLALVLTFAGCASRGPAPVVTGDQGPPPPAQITVQRGQTLSGIAHAYHVPMSVLADANHLLPPYRILVGQALIIPTGAEPDSSRPMVAMGGPMPTRPPPYGPTPTYSPLPVATPVAPSASVPVQAVPLNNPPLQTSTKKLSTTPPIALAQPGSAEVPSAAASLPSPATSPANPPTRLTPPTAASITSEHSAPPSPETTGTTGTAETQAPAAHGDGTFLWPVRGRVLEGFGTGQDGTHNDGINIAASRGAAIEATDGGIVAYSGNELRGYGNLILVKHPNGWISAYAHCDLVLVKTGQKVVRGQVIARVGATGNVSEPQLHFELRRGKKPVDPREYLPPLSTTASKEGRPS